MKLRWRQGLSGASASERWVLQDAQKYLERVFLEEVVSALCSLSPLGFVDCADLRATCKLRRWGRRKRLVYAVYGCTTNQAGASSTRCVTLDPLRAGHRRPAAASKQSVKRI